MIDVNENGPMGIRSSRKIIINPIDPRLRYALACGAGRSMENTREPSRGGIGNKLKIASKRLICIMGIRMILSGETVKRRIRTLAMMAIRIFVAGPASATSAMSFLPSCRLNSSTGTGFAAPKITGEPERIKSAGKIILIIGSMCFLGSSVSLPASRAVGSPSLSATYPWAISCRIAEPIKITKLKIIDTISIN